MEQHAQVRDFLDATLKAMGLTLQIDVEDTADSVRLQLSGDGADVLLRRRAETLDALQHIVNTGFRRQLKDDRTFVLDSLDYRKGKDAELKQMAKFMIEKAKTSGAPQEMGPLNPYARRLVHLAVAEDPEMSSESIGDAFLKTVIISQRSRR
jgi:spoIIIJ-associated protein